MASPILIDNHSRKLTYLRVSITDRCNLRCMYCAPDEKIPKLSHGDILRYEEILRIIRVGLELGIAKIRVTGGEPLVRKGAVGFLRRIAELEGLADFSLTTNAVLLKDNLERIRDAGIKRLNISLDTLDREKYARITGRDFFDKVWAAIEGAREMGFDPIKLNAVALNGINDDEIEAFARLSFDHPYHIRFIEHMPIGKTDSMPGEPLLASEILDRLEELGTLAPVQRGMTDGPADRYKFEGAKGEIGLIRPLSRHFCAECNRLRLTASGQLRVCLLSDRQTDLKGPLRTGCSDTDLKQILIKAAQMKPSAHHLPANQRVSGEMSAIGG